MTTITEAGEKLGQEDARHIVSISGGKDSAALALYVRQQYPEIPAEYVFCDTGCELPETYDYIDRLQALLGVEIVRANVFDVLGVRKKPGRNAFSYVLNETYGGFLPSPRARWCTRMLKIKPFEHFVGEHRAYSYIGIRADEHREGYVPKKKPAISGKKHIIPVYPFQDDGLVLADIKRILMEAGIRLPEYYRWRSRSGCYFCFYQQIAEWQGLLEEHPDLFAQAAEYEKTDEPNPFTWVEGRSLEDIRNLQQRYELPDMEDAEGCAVCHL